MAFRLVNLVHLLLVDPTEGSLLFLVILSGSSLGCLFGEFDSPPPVDPTVGSLLCLSLAVSVHEI